MNFSVIYSDIIFVKLPEEFDNHIRKRTEILMCHIPILPSPHQGF